MAAGPCKRRMTVRNETVGADGTVKVTIFPDVAEIVARVVDSGGTGVAWELGIVDTSYSFHFAAGESYTEEHLALEEKIELLFTAAAASIVELIQWEG
jgi:hypothetical protein